MRLRFRYKGFSGVRMPDVSREEKALASLNSGDRLYSESIMHEAGYKV